MTVTIKIGSNVLTCADGTLNVARMQDLVGEIAALHASGHRVILVSSGAVAAGRSMIANYDPLDPVSRRQLLSSVGQVKLIDTYKQLFDAHGIRIGQVLVTKQDFGTREHYLNMRNCIEALWDRGVVPIINENDAVSVTALMFTDNDELSGLVSSMMNCGKLLILSNVDGIFNGNPADASTQVIRRISPRADMSQYVQTTKSNFGRGGMLTKCRIAQKTADSGIEVYIANGARPQVITRLISGDPDFVCTCFEAGQPSPAVKKWIAYSEGFTKARVTINAGAKAAILSPDKANSLLLPGVVSIDGDFRQSDLLLIIDEAGETLGIGRAGMDKDKAVRMMGSKHTKPLVHYDYLYINHENQSK